MSSEMLRILIWGKTYPELSGKYIETVCTGGVLSDGRPVRLYPVPLRYLQSEQKYALYDWIEVLAERNPKDPRPESYRLQGRQIQIVDSIGTDDHWRARRDIVFKDPSWQFESVHSLLTAQ